jgi:hypothetical protein
MAPKRLPSYGYIVPATMFASAFFGLLTTLTLFLAPTSTNQAETSIYLTPTTGTYQVGDTFTVTVGVTASLPVNAFTGLLHFDPRVLSVTAIDYNTSIADLWAKAPWYENGDGTIGFTGGTTKPGGFRGHGELLTVTFTAKQSGSADITIHDAQILLHDGQGTEATIDTSLDTIFTVENSVAPIIASPKRASTLQVQPTLEDTDLSHNGTTDLADISILMLYITTQDVRGDVNGDGWVGSSDLSLILSAR